MLGTVEEPMEKVLSSGVVDSDLFDAEMEDGSDTESRDQKLINAIKSGNSMKDELISSSAKDGEADDDSSDDEVIRPIRRKSRSPGSKENHQNEDHNSPVRRKTKPHMILDSDEDSEDDGNGQSERLVPENNESEPKGMNSDNDNDNDEEHRSSKHGLSSAKKKNRSIIESDDDDDGHDVINGDVFDDEMECSESTKRNSVLESDKDNNDSDSEQQKSDGLGDAENEEDEMCEGEEMVRAGKKKKSKKPSSLEPRRTKQAALEQIHSESQRLVRDAALNLPYHKPKPLTLDDFFKKKSIIQEIQPIRGHFKKPQAAIKSVNLAIQSKEEKKRAKDGKQKKEDDDPKPEMRETNTNTENTENKAEENVTDSGISTTPGKMDSKSQGRSSGKLKLLKKVASVTPRLSGNSDSFIDLDDSGISESKPSTKMKGIQELMSRFVKHTAKPKPKATQQVQLSVVQKETNETGKEELKCNTLTVTVDGDEDIDPKLKVPGQSIFIQAQI
ncbi:claspin-like [Ptychodera flava]|uniref:claspin-like n=1 Tax=Ptychodera flava TaxID=63121 RepID=UPI00396A61B7